MHRPSLIFLGQALAWTTCALIALLWHPALGALLAIAFLYRVAIQTVLGAIALVALVLLTVVYRVFLERSSITTWQQRRDRTHLHRLQNQARDALAQQGHSGSEAFTLELWRSNHTLNPTRTYRLRLQGKPLPFIAYHPMRFSRDWSQTYYYLLQSTEVTFPQQSAHETLARLVNTSKPVRPQHRHLPQIGRR